MADSRTSFIHKNLIHKITTPLQLPVFTYLKKLPYFLLTVKKSTLYSAHPAISDSSAPFADSTDTEA